MKLRERKPKPSCGFKKILKIEAKITDLPFLKIYGTLDQKIRVNPFILVNFFVRIFFDPNDSVKCENNFETLFPAETLRIQNDHQQFFTIDMTCSTSNYSFWNNLFKKIDSTIKCFTSQDSIYLVCGKDWFEKIGAKLEDKQLTCGSETIDLCRDCHPIFKTRETLAKLEIPLSSKIVDVKGYNKKRCSQAKVLKMTPLQKKFFVYSHNLRSAEAESAFRQLKVGTFISWYSLVFSSAEEPPFLYQTKKIVTDTEFDTDENVVCGRGIHFFDNEADAINFKC